MTISRRALLGSALLSPLALSACGQSAGSRPGQIRIVTPDFAGTDRRVVLEDVILGTFAGDATTIVDYTAWDRLNEKLTTGIASGIVPDAVMIGVGWIEPFASKGVFDELPSDLFTQFGINDALRPVVEYEGKLHGLPYVTECRMFIYNRRIFDERGITEAPQSLTELRDLCRELQDGELMPIDIFSNNPRQSWLHFVSALGGTLFTEDGRETAFTNGSGADALQFMLDLVADGSADFNRRVSPGQPRPWQREEAIIDLTSTGEWPNLVQQSPDLITEEASDFFLMPGADGQDPVLYLGGTMLALAKDSPNREVAEELLHHMFEPELLLAAGNANGKLPPVQDLPPDPDFESNRMGVFSNANYDYAGAFEGGSAAWMEIREQVGPQIEGALTGQQGVTETIDNLARISNTALDRLT